MKNKVWYYLGQGMASFGIQDTWIEEEKMQPKPDGDTMNFAYFEGRKTEPGEVISLDRKSVV